jgi:hypothetical protein
MSDQPTPAGFAGLDQRMLRWLEYEQTVNERLLNPAIYMSIANRVQPHLRPESRGVWDQEVIWLPRDRVRCFGNVDGELRAAFSIEPSKNRTPLFLHPHPPAAHKRLRRRHGSEPVPGIAATPTSSYRSVVTWSRNGERSPVLLKLSLGAIVGRIRRAFREDQIARAVVISALFDAIPVADRERLRLDWFSEPAGAAETHSEHGWLLRRLPRCFSQPGKTTAIPVCSLISRREDRPPLLVELIGQSRQTPEAFVVDRLLRPYVKVLAYLLFEQGLQCEAHSQNVLVEIGERDGFTGRLVLRDLSDTTVNIAFRIARGKTLPVFPRGFLPAGVPFPVVANASDFRNNFFRSVLLRGYDTVEHYGLWGFVWPINTSLKRFFKRYDSWLVETQYLELWQKAAIQYLNLRPLFRKRPKGIATDEAIACFLSEVDWRSLGASPARLHAAAEPLLVDGRMRRRGGKVYDRLECPWGDLFISNGLPGFFRPAF